MRDLDLKMDDDEKGPTPAVTPEIVSPPARASEPRTADLSEAHEMLLQDLDEVRKAAQLVTERMVALEAKLAPREASIATQSQALERVAREVLSEAAREWAETAQRYRKFVDDMGSLAAWQEARLNKMPALSTWKPLAAAFLGGLLAGFIVLAMSSAAGGRLRTWIAGAPAAIDAPPPTTVSEPASAAPTIGRKPAKPGAR